MLADFLAAHDLSHLEDALVGESLSTCVQRLFKPASIVGALDSRPAFLSFLAERGVKLKDRQALANALARASREGEAGVVETEDDVQQRTDWLDLHYERSLCEEDAPMWPPSKPYL